MPVTISAEQREALYFEVLSHLSGIGDIWFAVDAREYRKAKELGRAFMDDLRLLLDDLGWPDRTDLPPDGSVELTMPPADLRRVIGRLREEATEVYADALPRSEDDRQVLRRSELAIEACGRVLTEVDRQDASSDV